VNVTIVAVGRLKAGPERELVARYLERAVAAGRRAGLTVQTRVLPESRAGSAEARCREEADAILSVLPDDARLVALDERGKPMTSDRFAGTIGQWRDAGIRDAVLAIGGADGHGEAIRNAATATLSFGAMTWPHQIARILAAEQVYRAVTILTGHPYHRG